MEPVPKTKTKSARNIFNCPVKIGSFEDLIMGDDNFMAWCKNLSHRAASYRLNKAEIILIQTYRSFYLKYLHESEVTGEL